MHQYQYSTCIVGPRTRFVRNKNQFYKNVKETARKIQQNRHEKAGAKPKRILQLHPYGYQTVPVRNNPQKVADYATAARESYGQYRTAKTRKSRSTVPSRPPYLLAVTRPYQCPRTGKTYQWRTTHTPTKQIPTQQQQQEAAEPESACSDHFSDPSAQVDSTKYASTSLTLCTLNVRGMHSSITDVIMILRNKERIPDILALTETKHSHINSLWRITLQQYKLHHNVPEINPETNRRSAGTVLAINKTKFTSSTSIDVPSHLTGYLTAATAR